MKKFGFYLVIALACLPVFAVGQAPAKPASKPVPTICDVKEPDCKDKLKLENLDLKIGKIVDEFNAQAKQQFDQMVKPQMQPLQDERAKLIQKLNAAHPGYQWYDPTGPGDIQGFQPVPASPAPAPATAPTKPVDKPAASQ